MLFCFVMKLISVSNVRLNPNFLLLMRYKKITYLDLPKIFKTARRFE